MWPPASVLFPTILRPFTAYIAKFSPDSNDNVDPKAWAKGGQVYLDYALLYERIEPDQAKLSGDESGEPFGKLAERFRRGLAAWQHDADENFKLGVSRTLLNDFGKKYIEKSGIIEILLAGGFQ